MESFISKIIQEGLLTSVRKREVLKMLCRVINCNNILNKVIYWENILLICFLLLPSKRTLISINCALLVLAWTPFFFMAQFH